MLGELREAAEVYEHGEQGIALMRKHVGPQFLYLSQ